MNLSKLLKELSFEYKGEILHTKGSIHPSFNLADKLESQDGLVYLWIRMDGKKPLEVIYVGKAGKTLKNRCKQHEGGFKFNKTKGVKNSNAIQNILSDGFTINIFSRISETIKVFDEEVSLCVAEEKALITKFDKEGYRLLNKISSCK
jgi:hypothetical protein